MFERIFEFFFKYRQIAFEKGDFGFGASRWMMFLGVALVVAAAGTAFVTYHRVSRKTTSRDMIILGTLRGVALAVLLFALFRPMLVLSAAIPMRNVIGILLDDSRSMQVADQDGKPRGDVIKEVFGNPDDPIMRQLKERFILRFFSFSRTAERIANPTEMSYLGNVTYLGGALERARQELASAPLAGMVVVTDGADNSRTPMADQLLALQAKGVPVFTVGVGMEEFKKDVEITKIEMSHEALKGSSVVADLDVQQNGYAGQKVEVIVEDSGRIITKQAVTLPGDGEPQKVRVVVTANDVGARLLNFKIAPQAGEVITENNDQVALLQVSNRVEKILYFEGAPRPELKFLRMALTDDKNLQLVTLVRTADQKYLRLAVDSAEELISGFPKTREELFSYTGLVLGDVEAAAFTNDQLKMISDFVSERGGGLLALGGRNAFAEGGYMGTPVADVLPLALGNVTIRRPEDLPIEMKVQLTNAGMIHPAVQIGENADSTQGRYRDLPPLTAVNDITQLKPGATALLTGTPTGIRGGRQIVLAHQRFGRGKSLAMPVQDVWLWQMHADISVEDQTQEKLWRQLLRWMVTGVPGKTTVFAATDRAAPDEPVPLRAEVTDENFVALNTATVTAYITAPTGEERTIPMDWAVDRDGEYRASFTPGDRGMHRIRVESKVNGKVVGADTTFVEADIPKNEYYDAKMHGQLLKRIATETEGRFYTPKTLSSLPEDLTYTKSGATVVQQLDLWDMPILFILLLGAIGGEWGYRKLKGLA